MIKKILLVLFFPPYGIYLLIKFFLGKVPQIIKFFKKKVVPSENGKVLEKNLIIDHKKNNELEKQESDDINWESLNISRNLFDFIEVYTLSGRKPSKSELKSIFDISEREGIQREEILVIIEKMINLGNQRKEKKLREKIIDREEKKQDFLKLITIENITNPKSKLFELLSNEQFSCIYTLYKDQIKIKGGISDTKQLEDSILGLKYIVIDRLFTSFFKLIKGDHTVFPLHLFLKKNKWFYTTQEKTHHDRPRPGFPNGVPIPYKGFVKLSKDNWGVYLDKNGWYFNPFSDKILFYYGNNVDDYPKTDEYDLDPFYDNPPNFIKGSLFKKPVFVLDNDTVVGIKSNKLCEESEKYYNYWYKFLKTIEQFKKESISNKSSTYKLELENSFEKWNQLETHFDEVNNILKSKESEIQSKEKEFQTNFIQDFIRTLNFIDENIKNSKNLNLRFQGRIERKTYESTEFIEQLNKLIESENLFITTNSSILFGLVDMIRSIIYDDRVRFYQIYEKFDKMRIFNSQHQNDVLNSLNSINDNLVELNSNIETLTNTIDNLGKELISSIRELKFEVSYLNDTISSQLQNISTKLDVNNLLNVVQTYQLWRINSNTKSINKKLNF